MQQRAWLLELVALELHFADKAVPAHRESIQHLLAALFHRTEGHGQSCMLDLLELMLFPLEPPILAEDLPPGIGRLQQRMRLDSLFASGNSVEEGGVRCLSARGHNVYNISALAQSLRTR